MPKPDKLSQFHDRAVVASLKPSNVVAYHERRWEFHDRAVVASLKRSAFRCLQVKTS